MPRPRLVALFRSMQLALRRGVIAASALCALGTLELGHDGTVEAFNPQPHPAPATLLPITTGRASSNADELMGPIRPGLIWAAPARHLARMQVTAYCPCPICCGVNACGITASGRYIDYNAGRFVAADPALAFGTKLIVPGYIGAPVEVIDRGGAIRGKRLDVFFPTHEQATQWGRKMLAITVFDE